MNLEISWDVTQPLNHFQIENRRLPRTLSSGCFGLYPHPLQVRCCYGLLEISGSTISWNIVENCLRVRRRRWQCSHRGLSQPYLAGLRVMWARALGGGAGKHCGRAPGEPRGVWAHRRLSGPGWAEPEGAGERSPLLSSRPAGGCPTVVLNERYSAKITPPPHLPQSKIVRLEVCMPYVNTL